MENTPLLKNRIKSTAAYITAAVLLIVVTASARKADGVFFSSVSLFKPAEMTAEAIIIIISLLYAARHRGKDLIRKSAKHIVYIIVPLIMVCAACFCLPDKILPAEHNLIHILDIFLSAFADDLVLCAAGCILLIHKGGFNKTGIIIMLVCMALYEAALTDEKADVLVFSIFAAVITGFFEIQLHLSAESALFCAVFHFLIRLCIHLPVLNTAQSEPYLGAVVSNAVYFAALILMFALGAVLYTKRRTKELEDRADY